MRESKSGRKIRRCAEKFYSEDLGLNINTHNITAFDLFEKVTSDAFVKNDGAVEDLDAKDVTLQNILRRGFYNPFIVRAETGKPPGLRVPDADFSAKDVERLVGSTRKVDVMDVSTQRSLQMTMHQWAKYFESDKRDTLLNVISLEVSQTPLCDVISPPNFVRELDWVETVWPPFLKSSQAIGTNDLSKMKYPKVQKYCLMSVRGSYTDFHVDFGGTSVWYHLVAGAKVFWLIPPTEENLSKFVKWTLAGKQSDIFFGDLVDTCYRVHLFAGDTFYLPGGWIHGVYTPRKSLVFGGNFLHSYNIVGQLKVTAIEDITKVEPRYLYPFFVEMSWFVVEKYHKYLKHAEDHGKGNSVLMEAEVEGLHLLISRLEDSSIFQATIPAQIKDPKALVKEVRDLLLHAEVDQDCCDFSEPLLSRDKNNSDTDEPIGKHNGRLITSNRPFRASPVTYCVSSEEESDGKEESDEDSQEGASDVESEVPQLESLTSKNTPNNTIKSYMSPESPGKRRKLTPTALNSYLSTYLYSDDSSTTSVQSSLASPVKAAAASSVLTIPSNFRPASKTCKDRITRWSAGGTRKQRCGLCEGCTRHNCGRCKFCLDKISFGGPNVKRQSCIHRRCKNIGANHQSLFGEDTADKCCADCSISVSDWRNNPMLTCWNCDRMVHWMCQGDDSPEAAPSDQQLAVLWRWKCKECLLPKKEQKYGKPLSLEVPHTNVAVPVTLSVPFTDMSSTIASNTNASTGYPIGNIFTKLASNSRPEPKTSYPASNIFNKFQPKVVLTDRKPEVLKQAKVVLESNALISPSKLPSYTSQSPTITSSAVASCSTVTSVSVSSHATRQLQFGDNCTISSQSTSELDHYANEYLTLRDLAGNSPGNSCADNLSLPDALFKSKPPY